MKMRILFICLVWMGILLGPSAAPPAKAWADDSFLEQRRAMVQHQIRMRGISAPHVLAAMEKVPRHRFVPPAVRSLAYADHPLPIGEGQTISQPYIVALMTASLELAGPEKVLEIGTGSGYQAAVLAEICRKVYTIEIFETWAAGRKRFLNNLDTTMSGSRSATATGAGPNMRLSMPSSSPAPRPMSRSPWWPNWPRGAR